MEAPTTRGHEDIESLSQHAKLAVQLATMVSLQPGVGLSAVPASSPPEIVECHRKAALPTRDLLGPPVFCTGGEPRFW
jgi:hypothetical protein